MKIAIPREQRPDEARVAASPESVKKLVALGFAVVVETGAGQGAAMLDAASEKAGASIAADAAAACAGADVIAKVRRQLPGEFARPEERRLGNTRVSQCRSRRLPEP